MLLLLALAQELVEGGPAWSTTSTAEVTVASLGGSIRLENGVPEVAGGTGHVIARGAEIVEAVWEGRRLTRRRAVTLRGRVTRIALMPPVGVVELEGTEGDAELTLEIVEDPDAPAEPRIDEAGRVRMGGPAVVLALRGRVTNGADVDLVAGAADLVVRRLASPEQSLDLRTVGSVTLEDVRAREIDASATAGLLQVSRVAASGEVELRATSGRVRVDGVEASRLKVESTSGTVEVAGGVGLECAVESTSGSVALRGLHYGDVRVETASGFVEIVGCNGDRLEVKTASGDVRLSSAQFAERNVESSSGRVTEE